MFVLVAPLTAPARRAIRFFTALDSVAKGLVRHYLTPQAAAPFAYCGILYAAVWGIVFYREYPKIRTGVGALVIVRAGLYVWHHERATSATA